MVCLLQQDIMINQTAVFFILERCPSIKINFGFDFQPQHECLHDAKCYSYHEKCDGEKNCDDGSDEDGCPNTETSSKKIT